MPDWLFEKALDQISIVALDTGILSPDFARQSPSWQFRRYLSYHRLPQVPGGLRQPGNCTLRTMRCH